MQIGSRRRSGDPADGWGRSESAPASRTGLEQIVHWARIGRALEMSPQVNHRAIAHVLAGDGSYDVLGGAGADGGAGQLGGTDAGAARGPELRG